MLYESYIHPDHDPVGAAARPASARSLWLMLFHYDLSVIAIVGIILLIGIVKKNAIMMIDFALDGRAQRGQEPGRGDPRGLPVALPADHDDDHVGAASPGLPLAIGHGAGSELRRPLGIAIVGGLLVSQSLTLYTTCRFCRAAIAYVWRSENASMRSASTSARSFPASSTIVSAIDAILPETACPDNVKSVTIASGCSACARFSFSRMGWSMRPYSTDGAPAQSAAAGARSVTSRRFMSWQPRSVKTVG